MHGGAVVPHHDVARVPDMAEMVLRLARFSDCGDLVLSPAWGGPGTTLS